MKMIFAILALALLLCGWGNAPGPGPVGPPGPAGPTGLAGSVGGADGGVDCREQDHVPKGQSCGRRKPRKALSDLFKH